MRVAQEQAATGSRTRGRVRPGRLLTRVIIGCAGLALAGTLAPNGVALADGSAADGSAARRAHGIAQVADGYTRDMITSEKPAKKSATASHKPKTKPSAAATHAAKPSRVAKPAAAAKPAGTRAVPTAAESTAKPKPVATPTVAPKGSGPDLAASEPSGPVKSISLNFANVPVRDALATIAEYARVDVLVTPGANGNVTINLRSRSPDESVRLVASSAGLTVARVGESYIVGPVSEVRQTTAQMGTTEVVALHWAKPEDAKALVQRVAPLCGAEAGNNNVVLTGLPEDVQTARKAILALDIQPPAVPGPKPETEIKVIRSADPAMVERSLRAAFPEVKTILDAKTLTVTGTHEDLQAITRALQVLDPEPKEVAQATVPPPAPERTTAVYQLKYLNAKKTEETIKKLFPTLTVSAGPEPTAPPAANFNPLSISFLGTSSGGGFNFSNTSTSLTQTNTTQGVEVQPLSRSTQLIMVGPAADITAARALLDQTDVAPSLVRIEASIIEVSHTVLDQLGIRWDFSNTAVTFTVPGGRGLNFRGIQMSNLSFTAALDALIQNNRARLLANPNISVVDNEDANIFIGDLVRFRGVNVVSPNVGTVQGTETIPVGIALLVRPRIHPEGDVTLKVHPVVSSISSFIDGLPQTSSREADTTVRLARGEQLVIGGLTRNDHTRLTSKVPIIGDIPLIGGLFQSHDRRDTQTEIVVVIRAYPATAEPAPAGQFRVPTDVTGGP